MSHALHMKIPAAAYEPKLVRSDCLWHDCKAIFSYSFHDLPFFFVNQSILQRHMLITCWFMVNLLSALIQEKYNNCWLQFL